MIQKQFVSVDIAGESPNAVIHGDDVRVKRADEVIEGGKRCDCAAGCDVNVHTEGCKAGFRMIFRIGMDGNMAFVQMGKLGFADRDHRFLGNQDGDRGALRVIILTGNVQNLCADHVGQGGQDFSQSFGIVLFIDIGDVVPLFPRGFGVADIIDVKAQCFGQVVKAVQL